MTREESGRGSDLGNTENGSCSCESVAAASDAWLPAAEWWIDEHPFTKDDGGVPAPEMRPLVLVRQIRFCGLWGGDRSRGCPAQPWVGIAIVTISLGLMATRIATFLRS